jgi:hypothetical protein
VSDFTYHGGFEHPVRAFAIGVTLLVLLFGGFALGVEAGAPPADRTAVRVITRHGHRIVKVAEPVTTRLVRGGHTQVVHLPGAVRTRVVVIRRHGRTIVAYRAPSSTGDGPGTLQTLYVETPGTVTVTEPGSTVTETSTVTVTEPSSSDSTGSDTTTP